MRLRWEALKAFDAQRLDRPPVVLETHGGEGVFFAEVYRPAGVVQGVVFEKDGRKTDAMARERRTWAVYEGDCEKALAAGAASHLSFDVVDLDPWGSPFAAMIGVLSTPRPLADTLHLVVTDGLRQKVRVGGAWDVLALKDIVRDFGNNLYPRYLEAAKEKVRRLAAAAGYGLTGWRGYYCGAQGGDMSHYHAVLTRGAE